MKIRVKNIEDIKKNFAKYDVILDEGEIKEWDRYAEKEFNVKEDKNGLYGISTYIIQDEGYKGDILNISEIEEFI